MTDLIVRDWNGKKIRQRADGFLSLTDMCQAGGKRWNDFTALKATQEYLELLTDKHYQNSGNGPVESRVGGSAETTGTWGDRRVALRLAQWISPAFALQVDEWVEELLLTGTVSIANEATPEPVALPPADVRVSNLVNSLEKLGFNLRNPRYQQGLQDLAGDILGIAQPALSATPMSVEKWYHFSNYGVAERAEQLGIPVGLVVKHRSQLGKVVKAQIDEDDRKTEKRLCSGTMRDICLYRASSTLDAAIEAFFAIKAVA